MAAVKICLATLATLCTPLSLFILFPLWRPTTPLWWALKAVPTVLAIFMLAIGAALLVYGFSSSALYAKITGIWLTGLFIVHIWRVSQGPGVATGFDQAFGPTWKAQLEGYPQHYALKTRFGVSMPGTPHPIFQQDIPFYSFSNSTRKLLCDIWEPPPEVRRSGLAFIYLHGSAWYVLDKDTGTRNFFRQLAAQGHVIMDVAYRLYPETDMLGMVHDTRHAIAWMKEHADDYQVKTDKIVVGGGSAGAHIALLTALTSRQNDFKPADLIGADTEVAGVISLYGPTDLEALYYHTGQNVLYERQKAEHKKAEEMPAFIQKLMGESYQRLGFDKSPEAGLLATMFGGSPDEVPTPFRNFSPVTHVTKNAPPMLLIQSTHDLITSTSATKIFYGKLRDAGVPVVLHLIPQTDHAFDLFLPKRSPSAHNAYFDIEQFLALLAVTETSRPVQKNEQLLGMKR